MRTFRYFFLLLLFFVAVGPAFAQKESDEADNDTVAVADNLAADTLQGDSISRLPWPEKMRAKIKVLLDADMFQTSQVGMMIWDLDADSCIFRYRDRQLLRPASCMKLVTAITAIDRLGGSYQFKTQLRYTGEVRDSVLYGNVYCVGGMDPRFNSDDMLAIVASLKGMGVDSIAGTLYADKSMKDSKELGRGWCWDDDNYVLTPLLISRRDNFMPRFIERLRDEGIALSDTVWKTGECPSGSYLITTRSHAIDQVLGRMMKESDNLYAESMYYQIAHSAAGRHASARDAANAEKRLVGKIGFDPAGYSFADGSGLSLYNYVSAELLVNLLRYASKNDNIYMHLYPALPVAGVDGTLSKRMRGTFAQNNVHAKTGTLTGCISLAGYCRAVNGHNLCFAIINQGIMHGRNARNFQDKVCQAMCDP